jgi:hypothetical protein
MEGLNSDLKKLEEQLKEWGSKFDTMKAKVVEGTVQKQEAYQRRIDELKAKRDVAQAKFEGYKAAGAAQWDILKEASRPPGTTSRSRSAR